jgi:hypothetical protein
MPEVRRQDAPGRGLPERPLACRIDRGAHNGWHVKSWNGNASQNGRSRTDDTTCAVGAVSTALILVQEIALEWAGLS